MTTCIDCNAPVEMRPYVHTEMVGDNVVRDPSRATMTCTQCGATYVSAHALMMYEARAAAIVIREGKVTGEVLKYARKAMGLRQSDLAKLLERTVEWVSRWETGATVATRADQLAIVALLDEAWWNLYAGKTWAPPIRAHDKQEFDLDPWPIPKAG